VQDVIEQSIALLIGDLPFEEPYTVELFDTAGQLLGSHPWGTVPTS
jgi:hypothetical protein